MNCKYCNKKVKMTKESFYEKSRMCTSCYKSWKKIGTGLKKVAKAR